MCHLAKNYLIIGDTLYCHRIDSILIHCLSLEEVESILNDCHIGAYEGHLFELATTQKILCVGCFWPSFLKDFIVVVKMCHPCQVYTRKMHAHTNLLFPVIIVGPFTKWGIYFTTCNLVSTKGHKYISVAVDYYTKWLKSMPTFNNNSETKTLFLFNHIISHFGIPKEIVTDHGIHFQNKMMFELD